MAMKNWHCDHPVEPLTNESDPRPGERFLLQALADRRAPTVRKRACRIGSDSSQRYNATAQTGFREPNQSEIRNPLNRR